MEANVNFVSGLPRSGSTLLMNLLGQNPMHHVTPTNDLITMFSSILRGWRESEAFKAQGLSTVKPKVCKSLGGMVNGFYEEELSKGMYCFDKSRGWPQFIEHLSECLDRPVKLIITVRDIRSIISSMETLYRSREIDWVYPVGDAFFQASTAVGRATQILAADNLVGHPINQLRDLLERSPESVHLVSYEKLCATPKIVLHEIHEALGLPEFDKYDPDNVKQLTFEDDSVHGRGATLHKIRPKIEPTNKKELWKEYYTESFLKDVASAYTDIHDLL